VAVACGVGVKFVHGIVGGRILGDVFQQLGQRHIFVVGIDIELIIDDVIQNLVHLLS